MALFKPLIVCDGVTTPCDWAHLTLLIKVLIDDMIIISTLLAGAVFAYIGFILLTSGGNPAAMTRAKGMGMKVIKGYLWILFAWLVVYTITNTLLKPGYTLLNS
jgi:uncharacterized membrane protein